MRLAFPSSLLLLFGTLLAHAQISSFKHVIVIVQENRTPDNLFQGLCRPPFGTSESCSTGSSRSRRLADMGFRVPLIVVSAYTPAGYINNSRHDFGSILRFIEHNFGIPEGQLTFADRRATGDLTGFFHLGQPPRPFQRVSAAKDATYFLNDKTVPTDPDDD